MGAKQKYDEQTTVVTFRCPVSKVNEFRKLSNEQLEKWKRSIDLIKISEQDRHLLSNKKYVVKKIGKNTHIYRNVESAKGKFRVLLVQDIIGINCEILFIDGNSLNCQRDNFRPINREVEFLY